MDAPRLRLIVLAGLRGLIEPGYEHGANSVVREQVLLQALAREVDGDTFLSRGIIEAMMANVIAPSERSRTYEKAINFLLQGTALKKLEGYKQIRKITISGDKVREMRKMATALMVLKSTDFCERMSKILSEVMGNPR